MTTAPNMPPNKVAFIIDNEVVDIIHTDDRLAAIFLLVAPTTQRPVSLPLLRRTNAWGESGGPL
jgi:hypothetical protein